MKALCELCRTVTVGRFLRTLFLLAVFNFSKIERNREHFIYNVSLPIYGTTMEEHYVYMACWFAR